MVYLFLEGKEDMVKTYYLFSLDSWTLNLLSVVMISIENSLNKNIAEIKFYFKP